MPLPINVELKFNLYTLASQKLLDQLHLLRECTFNNPKISYKRCIEYFNEVLIRFFNRASVNRDRQAAANQLAILLETEASLLENQNKEVASTFNKLASEIRKESLAWNYKDVFDQFNLQGRDLACRFYEADACPEIQDKLNKKCFVSYHYSKTLAGAPMSYWQEHEGIKDVILVRFTFEHDFFHYLAYPFMFMHEYTAHVYANDLGCNDRFHDGWMMHAAAAFLEYEWGHLSNELNLHSEQAHVFYRGLYDSLDDIAYETCMFARHLDAFLSPSVGSESFKKLTCELASFYPQSDEKEYWPTDFIRELERAFWIDELHRKQLLEKLQLAKNIRDLMQMLKDRAVSKSNLEQMRRTF